MLPKSQKDNQFHPSYHMSKKITDLESKYCIYELAILSVVEALKKIRICFLEVPFVLVTDCSTFQKI